MGFYKSRERKEGRQVREGRLAMAGWGATTSPIYRLARRLNDNDALFEEGTVKEDALFLAQACPMIEAALGDAEEREIGDTSVKLWLCDLKYLAADAEDVLEEYEYEYQCHLLAGDEIVEEEEHLRTTFLNKLFIRLEVFWRLIKREDNKEIKRVEEKENHVQATFHNELSKSIRIIRKRFDDIYQRKKAFILKNVDRNRHSNTTARPKVGHLANEPILYGRDKDKKRLMDLLKNETIGVVIDLVGIGGTGKTTLAQAVYNDEIDRYFDCKAWVTVSKTFDVMQIAKDMLASLTGVDSNLTQLSVIQENLANQLQGKKFFLVLDDIWEEKIDSLGFLLQMGSRGSKILLTTRIRRVANARLLSEVVDLEPLMEQDSWELFCSHAFGGTNKYRMTLELVEIGKEIMKRCKGLPLLLRVLGDDLREASVDKRRWREILNHDISGDNDVMEILMPSYYHLPRRLRQCFLHCSVFPKGYKFDMDELARMRAAHGLIEAEGLGHIEEIGEMCVKSLLQRSFVQQYTQHLGITRYMFSLHDIMHDLAQYILHSEQSLIKDRANTVDLHCALTMGASQTVRCYYEPIVGRTFIHSSKQVGIIDMLTQHLKHLRVLILADLNLHDIPNSIGDLKHLRYLCVHAPLLRRLPESVCSLHNLQTLECMSLEKLPRNMRKLKRLQHLLVNVVKFPPWIGELVELQTLLTFHVWKGGDGKCARLSHLKDLKRLGGKFQISGLNNVNNIKEAKLLSLSNKPNLKHLFLNWDPDSKCISKYKSFQVLGNLQPHDNLEELDIYNYLGASLPKWMESPLFVRLTNVKLYYCSRCVALPAFGQLPSLKNLFIRDMHRLERIGHEFYGSSPSDAFPSLANLQFVNMNSLREWWGMDKCPFPRLSHVYLEHCHSLRFPTSNMYVGIGRARAVDSEPFYCVSPQPDTGTRPSMSWKYEPEANLRRMFKKVRLVDVKGCPHVEDWCEANAFTILADVMEIKLNNKYFR